MIRNLAILLAASAVVAMPLAAQNASEPADPVFVAKLKAALRENPEIIIQAAQAAQQKQRAAAEASQERQVAQMRPVLMAREPVGPVIGNPNAAKTVVELLDYACGYCKQAHPTVNKIAGDEVRFVIIMHPVLGPDSETLARYALAAAEQGRFQQAHVALYETFGNGHRTKPTDETLRQVSQKAGVDFDQAKRDMTGDNVMATLARHQQIAQEMGVGGTPFFLTPKRVIPGAATEAALRAAL